jgi:peptidoglycan hydrolase-like protein with peptidoglycan-binding domain
MVEVDDIPMRPGDSGEPIRRLQERLADVGLYPGEATGRFDEVTESAVRELQERFQIPATGVYEDGEALHLQALEYEAMGDVPAAGWVWDGEQWVEDNIEPTSLLDADVTGGQVSEDGHWRWDGFQWQPIR